MLIQGVKSALLPEGEKPIGRAGDGGPGEAAAAGGLGGEEAAEGPGGPGAGEDAPEPQGEPCALGKPVTQRTSQVKRGEASQILLKARLEDF